MKKHNIMIPKPRSNFVKIECDNCQNTMIIIHIQVTKTIKCSNVMPLVVKHWKPPKYRVKL